MAIYCHNFSHTQAAVSYGTLDWLLEVKSVDQGCYWYGRLVVHYLNEGTCRSRINFFVSFFSISSNISVGNIKHVTLSALKKSKVNWSATNTLRGQKKAVLKSVICNDRHVSEFVSHSRVPS